MGNKGALFLLLSKSNPKSSLIILPKMSNVMDYVTNHIFFSWNLESVTDNKL